MLDQAFSALNTYDWGTDPGVLQPIDDAVATQGDADARKALEARLVAVLDNDVSRDAKGFVCRKLMLMGTATAVPALAKLLPKKEHSHMARYALERIPAPEAAKAMRDALPKLHCALKVGLIGSLGARRDTDSVGPLAELLGDDNPAIGSAAALALGAIRSPQAAKVLASAKPSAESRSAVTDALLACAEGLVADGKPLEALAIYKGLTGDDQTKHVRLAATRGMLTCAGNK